MLFLGVSKVIFGGPFWGGWGIPSRLVLLCCQAGTWARCGKLFEPDEVACMQDIILGYWQIVPISFQVSGWEERSDNSCSAEGAHPFLASKEFSWRMQGPVPLGISQAPCFQGALGRCPCNYPQPRSWLYSWDLRLGSTMPAWGTYASQAWQGGKDSGSLAES